MKVAQLEQVLQNEEQLRFDRRLACLKADIKLFNYQYYDELTIRDNTVNITNVNIRHTQLELKLSQV